MARRPKSDERCNALIAMIAMVVCELANIMSIRAQNG